MHNSEETPQVWDGIDQFFIQLDSPRQYLIQIAKENPLNLDIIHEVGGPWTRKAAASWAARAEAVGDLPCIGTMRDANGRKVAKVWCGTKYKDDNLRHEIAGTRLRLLYPFFECERGHKLNDCYPDMVFKNGEFVYEVEIDCGTMPQKRVKARWKQHKCNTDILVVVDPKDGTAEDRLTKLVKWSAEIGDRAFFTTLARLKQYGPHERVWEYVGRENRPLARVKLPVSSAYQRYIQNTAQTVIAQQESGDVDEAD